MQLYVKFPTLILCISVKVTVISIIFHNHVDMLLGLLVFPKPILLLNPHSLHASFVDVSSFKELQLLLDALVEISNVLHKNFMIVDKDYEKDCFLIKLGDVVLDKLIILLLQVLPLELPIFSWPIR